MRILITAGPTREPIDAVRFIGNRSSGRMGVALAEAALDAGCEVTLLLSAGVAAGTLPSGVVIHRFESTADLQTLLRNHWPSHDVLVMAAAVADYRPASVSEGKIPREADGSLVLRLEPTPDLVAEAASARQPHQRIVAFALEEPEHLEQRAHAKLERKRVDAIVANPLATMDAGDIDARWIAASGEVDRPGVMTKPDFARWLVSKLARWK